VDKESVTIGFYLSWANLIDNNSPWLISAILRKVIHLLLLYQYI
jgi:hypothetical protein